MRLSYVRGPERPQFDATIDQAVRDTAERFPDREAVVSRHQNRRLTWREFDSEAERVARGLAGLGLQTQDRVGVWASNCIEWLLLQIACSRANLVLVNVNPAYRAHDLSYVLRKSRMRALFLRESDTRANYSEILEQTGARPEHVVYLDHPSWDDMLAHGRDVTNTPTRCADITNIQYTSGTTGSPKGVLLTHHNFVNNAWLFAERIRLTEYDRYVLCLPLYHTGMRDVRTRLLSQWRSHYHGVGAVRRSCGDGGHRSGAGNCVRRSAHDAGRTARSSGIFTVRFFKRAPGMVRRLASSSRADEPCR
jgi:fatty-acyl-CoA synthase